MATAPVSRKLNLTRDQLAQFLTDQQQIRQFELLFTVADAAQYIPDELVEVNIVSGNAQATANDALAQISALAKDTDLTSLAPRAELGTIAPQNSDNVNITGGLISGLDAPLAVASGGIGVTTAASNVVFAGPTAGAAAAPTFRSLVGADIPALTTGSSILYGNGSGGFSNVSIGSGVSFAGGILSATGLGGTVTSVAALTLGTTGTDLSSTVANGTTTPVITLNVPTASAANRGALSSTDWSTFNNKEPAIAAGTTAQYWRGDKTWQDFATSVRAAVLTGLSTATNAVITAADTVLSAFGKLQAQITAHVGASSSVHGVTGSVVGTSDSQTLTNKTISGASNTLTNIGNASLTNSSVTVNGTTISLGGAGTVTAAAGTLTGTTLNATVTASSLTSVGTLTQLFVGTGATGKFNVGGGRSYFGANSETYAVGFAYSQTRVNSGQMFYVGATDSATPDLVLSNAAGTEIARVNTNGAVFSGCTSLPGAGTSTVGSAINNAGYVSTYRTAGTAAYFGRTNDGEVAALFSGTTQRGTISIAGAVTTYGSVSDYRVKENISGIDNPIERLMKLKPVRFNFKGVIGNKVDGFIAHEVKEVVPEAVVGEKDATTKNGDDILQSLDAAKLIPLLVAAIQDQQKKIKELSSKLCLQSKDES
jgi:hypothetical protein